ncbi:DUF6290 family protein [Anaerococcus murdochii]|uniref:DUF6290 family protein n=1 Tax=Anaerococcus murdochii TaxID=411577 RepID=A0ABS7SZS6_9FIRM|nr:DUF6290 family protein [Anaerococcus murdochii]MBZ2387044.1 DUF6290 family protein [Anaerococcus murdochii]
MECVTTIISIYLNKGEYKLFRNYSNQTRKNLSDLFKIALINQIKDEFDNELGIKALESFNNNSITYEIDDLIFELENYM